MTRQIFLKTLLTGFVILGLLVLPSVLLAQGNSGAAFERVKAVQKKHTKALMGKPGVVGTAIGDGQGGRPIVLVLVEHGAVPGIPTSLEGVPVRPFVTGKIYALPKGGNSGKNPGGDDGGTQVDPTARFPRPVPIGVSTGHPEITAGTIGCRVVDADGQVYALSNNHVYANENQADIGNNVLQPGPNPDGGVYPDDSIGTLAAFVRIVFSTSASNTIDAAIAAITLGDFDGDSKFELGVGNATPLDGYGVPSSQIKPLDELTFRMKVKKYGRTTGQTTNGRVIGINGVFDIIYDTGTARFINQIVISGRGFSAPGDSGSLIVSDSENPVGLLFAGSSTTTIANPIEVVLDTFSEMVGSELTIDGK